MAIQWPAQLCPEGMSWALVYNNRDFTSTLSNAQQIVAYPGSYWRCSMSFAALRRRDERVMTAFLGRLQGRFGTFNLPAFTRKRDDDVGNVVIVTASRMASEVLVSGLTPSSPVFSLGDYISIAGELFEVLEDVVSSAQGRATLPLNRRLRRTIAGGVPVEYRNPYAEMRMTEDTYSLDVRAIVSGITLECREAF